MRTQQVILNLLTNALKFSKAKDVIIVNVKVSNLMELSDKIDLVISVTDAGIGISD